MSEPVDFSGEKDGDLLQGGDSLDESVQGARDGFAVTYVFGQTMLRSLDQALANLALSEAGDSPWLAVALHSEGEPNRSRRERQGRGISPAASRSSRRGR